MGRLCCEGGLDDYTGTSLDCMVPFSWFPGGCEAGGGHGPGQLARCPLLPGSGQHVPPPAFLRAERWGSSVWPGSSGRAFLAAGASRGSPGAALCTSVLSCVLGAGFLVRAFLVALRTPSAPASLSEGQEEAPWLAFQEKRLVF